MAREKQRTEEAKQCNFVQEGGVLVPGKSEGRSDLGAKFFSAQCSQLTVLPQSDVLLRMGYLRMCCHNSCCVQQLWLEFPSKNTAKFGDNVDGSLRNASAAHCQQAS